MSERKRCDECKQQRWLWVESKWTTRGMRSEKAPFDDGAWRHTSAAERSALIGCKRLWPCKTCNPEALPPWDKSFRGGQAAAEGPGASWDTPE